MRRRDFLAGLFVTVAGAARAAEPDKVYRIALISPSRPVSEMIETDPFYGTFFKELHRLGYVEGKNLVVLRFSAEGDTARYDPIVRAVMSAGPDVIITGNVSLVLRFKALVQSIPIDALMADPIANGIVASLARPGGNITGIGADPGIEVWGKRFAMLLETVPTATNVGFLCSDTLWAGAQGAAVREAARQFSVTLTAPPLKGVYQEPEYLRVFDILEREHAQVLLVSDSVENLVQRHLIVKLVGRARLPAIYPFREYIDIGGLMAYALDVDDMVIRWVDYADMILKGKKPGEIPIYQMDKFTTVVNLKTAKVLGLTIPPSLLGRADEVIE